MVRLFLRPACQQEQRKVQHRQGPLSLSLSEETFSSIRHQKRELIIGCPLRTMGFICFTAYQQTNRSEEHTSELQSRQYLVCRLLLEKKKPRARGQRCF